MHLKVRLSRRWGLFYTHSYQYPHYTDAEGEMNRSRTLAVTPAISLLSGTAAGEATETELVRSPDEQVTAYFREHSGAVYRYLAGVYGRESDAEEVTQEAFLRLHLALVAREKIENPKAWVLTVARRLMLDRLKRGRCEAVRHCTVAPDVAEVGVRSRAYAGRSAGRAPQARRACSMRSAISRRSRSSASSREPRG